MAGVRVLHVSARNCRFTVVEGDRPFKTPYQCTPPEFGGCGQVHLFKTHHLNLDENGSAIVEKVLFGKIQNNLIANGFSVANEVLKPPTLGVGLGNQRLGTGFWGNIPIIEGVINRG